MQCTLKIWNNVFQSVHFATENESISENEKCNSNTNSSNDMTLAQSEHLYSGDTFISESQSKKTLAGKL